MKAKLKIINIFLAISTPSFISAHELEYPKITFSYNYQSKCIDFIGHYFKNAVTIEQKKQLAQQLPHLEKAWHNNCTIFFKEVFELFKCGFKNPSRTGTIYLSDGWSYGSNRFLIFGLRYILSCDTQSQRENVFCTCVFHELLHIWINDNIKCQSKLLKKYCKEHAYVLDHIHLMAIQKWAFLRIGRPDLLSMIDKGYRQFSLPEYRRAWEIVNDIEGYQSVIQDILEVIEKKCS